MIEILAWFTVIGLPILLVGALVWLFIRWLQKTPIVSQPYAYTPPPPTWTEVKTTLTTTNDKPEVTSIAPEEEWDAEVDCRKIVEAGTRVWRVYRSIDQQNWAECDPALTERAACNYATYIKRNNPEEYVRVNDPEGIIVSYE